MLIALPIWSPCLVAQSLHGWPQLAATSDRRSPVGDRPAHSRDGSCSPSRSRSSLTFSLPCGSPAPSPCLVALLSGDSGLWRLRRSCSSWCPPDRRQARLPRWVVPRPARPRNGWSRRLARPGLSRARVARLASAAAVSGVGSVMLALPVLPAREVGPVIAANGHGGETLGLAAIRLHRRDNLSPRRTTGRDLHLPLWRGKSCGHLALSLGARQRRWSNPVTLYLNPKSSEYRGLHRDTFVVRHIGLKY